MVNNLEHTIIDEINRAKDKKISFKEYMALALYHREYGYYTREKINIGTKGDFFTSSSLGEDFGELLGEQFCQIWLIMNRPTVFTILEMGAGTGILARDIFKYLEKSHLDFFRSLKYVIQEESKALIEKQKLTLSEWMSEDDKISWKSWSEIPDNSLIGCCFSNELLDAFPVHKVILNEGSVKEIYVTYDNTTESFREIIDEVSTKEILDYFDLININLLSSDYPEGYQTEVNLASLHWVKTLSEKLNKGYIITIDYGYPAIKYYHPQRTQGTLQCYYQHHRHQNPYINIGFQDITTHVDFTAVQIQGETSGLETLGITKQGMFLMGLGLGDRLNSLSQSVDSVERLLKRRDALHQLIDPTGLGGFWVLAQTKGITQEEKQEKLKGFPEIALRLNC